MANAAVRLDPYALPQSFRYNTGLSGEAAQATVRLERATATVSRRLPSGLPMAVRMPIESFEGVAVRMVSSEVADDVTIVLELLHRDPSMSLPLSVTTTMDDVVADWRAWGRILGLPLLTVDADGSYKAVEERIGCVSIKPALPRRRRSVLAKRRPRFLARRRVGDTRRIVLLEDAREITSWE
jgi:hypothetical protein